MGFQVFRNFAAKERDYLYNLNKLVEPRVRVRWLSAFLYVKHSNYRLHMYKPTKNNLNTAINTSTKKLCTAR